MKLYYVSDIHLELLDPEDYRTNNYLKFITYPSKPEGSVLCLAGDICAMGTMCYRGIFERFLDCITKKFMYVVHIAGNHEFYSNPQSKIDMYSIHSYLSSLQNRFTNYIYLHNDVYSFKYDNKQYSIIGTTLWAAGSNPRASSLMNDYNYIYAEDNVKFTVKRMNALHQQCMKFLESLVDKIRRSSKRTWILMTHHKPVADSKEVDELTDFYEVDITDLVARMKNISVAIHGHTHVKYSKKINNTMYVSNPKGYKHQLTGYKKKVVIEI
jgi:predicted phosphohydrolase